MASNLEIERDMFCRNGCERPSLWCSDAFAVTCRPAGFKSGTIRTVCHDACSDEPCWIASATDAGDVPQERLYAAGFGNEIRRPMMNSGMAVLEIRIARCPAEARKASAPGPTTERYTNRFCFWPDAATQASATAVSMSGDPSRYNLQSSRMFCPAYEAIGKATSSP